MSGRDELDDMTPEEIAAWAARKRAASKEAFKDVPLPEISRVKRDDYPHWQVVAYMFHTRAGERVLVAHGDGAEVEGVLGGVRAARGPDELLLDLDGETWACTRGDGKDWSPITAAGLASRPCACRSWPVASMVSVGPSSGPCRPTWRDNREHARPDARPARSTTAGTSGTPCRCGTCSPRTRPASPA